MSKGRAYTKSDTTCGATSGAGSGDRSRHRLPRLGIRASENRAPDFADSPRESPLTPRRRTHRHDPLERSELARAATLRLFHRESAINGVATQTHVRVVTVPAGRSRATTQSSARDSGCKPYATTPDPPPSIPRLRPSTPCEIPAPQTTHPNRS